MSAHHEPAAVARALGLELTADDHCFAAVGGLPHVHCDLATLVGHGLAELVGLPFRETLVAAVAEARACARPVARECTIECDGVRVDLDLVVSPLADGRATVFVREVEGAAVGQRRLRESEARFRLMADHAPVMLWKAGTDALCDFFNARWLAFTGRALEQEIGVGWAEGVHPEDFQRCMDTYLSAFVAREPFRMEYRLRRADGEFRWLLDTGTPRIADDGSFEGYIGSCVDITAIRESANEVERLNGALAARVREREALVREVHHRVKNSLQLISSIFNLQSDDADARGQALLRDAQARVHAIAAVHEKLDGAHLAGEVDFAEYLRSVAGGLVRAFAGNGVTITTAAPRVSLPLDRAVPCGLLVNELLTNALKHAFVGRAGGDVRVEVAEDGDVVTVTVADDGVGLASGIEVDRPRSVGFGLVKTLVRQLGGTMTIAREGGTRISVGFRRVGGT